MPAETHVVRGPLVHEEILAMVRAAVAEVLGLPDDTALPPEADLVSDLGAGEMDVFDVAELVEEDVGERMVGFAFDDPDLAEIRTVGDLADHVAAKLAGRQP